MNQGMLLAMIRPLLLIVLATFLVTGTACGDEGTNDNNSLNNKTDVGQEGDVEEEEDKFALIGLWNTTYNQPEQISATKWDTMTIIEFNNAERWVITQNSPDEQLGANKYNKMVWTPINRGTTYYCMVEIGRNLLEQVIESQVKADSSDPEKGGCPEGSIQTWTRLTAL